MESVIILSYETSVGSIYTEFTRGRTNIYCNELQQQCSFNERSLIGKYLLHSTSSDTSWTTRAQWVISKRLYKVFPSLFPASYSIINRNILSWKVKPLCFFSYSVFGSFISFIICVSFCCRNRGLLCISTVGISRFWPILYSSCSLGIMLRGMLTPIVCWLIS